MPDIDDAQLNEAPAAQPIDELAMPEAPELTDPPAEDAGPVAGDTPLDPDPEADRVEPREVAMGEPAQNDPPPEGPRRDADDESGIQGDGTYGVANDVAQDDDSAATEDEQGDSSEELEEGTTKDPEGVLAPYGPFTAAPHADPLEIDVRQALEQDRLVFLVSAEGNDLQNFAAGLVFRYFNREAVAASTRASDAMRPLSSLNQAIESMQSFVEVGKSLLIVFDHQVGSDSVLNVTGTDWGATAKNFLRRMRRRNFALLVLTTSDKFDTLVTHFGGIEFEKRKIVLPSATDAINDANLSCLFSDRAQALTTWCLAWFNQTSAGGVMSALERVLMHKPADAVRLEDAVDRWRVQFQDTARLVAASTVLDERIGLRLELPSRHVLQLRAQFMDAQIARHREALTLLRESRVIQQAADDMLRDFGYLMAHLAVADPSIGRRVLTLVAGEWLDARTKDRRAMARNELVLTTIYTTLTRAAQPDLAPNALVDLCHAGHSDLAAAILARIPERDLRENHQFEICRRVLPAVANPWPRKLWARFFKAWSGHPKLFYESFASASSGWTEAGIGTFVGRYIEEALFGDSPVVRRRLVEMMSSSPEQTQLMARVLLGPGLNSFAAGRRKEWALDQPRSLAFEAWLFRGLISARGTLFGALWQKAPSLLLTRRARRSPVLSRAIVIALLLIDAHLIARDAEPQTGESFDQLLAALVPDDDTAFTVSTALRIVSSRLLHARSTLLARRGPAAAVRLRPFIQFTTTRSIVANELRRSIATLHQPKE